MKRVPCLTCNVNITFINNKRGLSLIYSTSAILCLKYFSFFSMVYYCDLPVTNPVMVFLQIMFVITFLVRGLVSQFLFFLKIKMCAFIVLALAQNVVTVLLLHCLLQTLHFIKYSTILELHLIFFFI